MQAAWRSARSCAKTCGHGAAGFVGDQGYVFACFDGKAHVNGVFCAGHQVGLWWPEFRHGNYFNVFGDDL